MSRLVQSGCQTRLSKQVLAAYDAPFPDESFMAGPRAMPGLVPTSPDDPASAAKATNEVAQRLGVDMPLCAAVYQVLYQQAPAAEVVRGLMSRPIKPETE